jgi:hypothetical protein
MLWLSLEGQGGLRSSRGSMLRRWSADVVMQGLMQPYCPSRKACSRLHTHLELAEQA